MTTARDFPITTPFGQVDFYPLNNGFHKGEDRIMPTGTPILINGLQIGLSGNSGHSTGSHLHTAKFVRGIAVSPQGGGFTLNQASVLDTGRDDTNGLYVRISSGGEVWAYCHMSRIDVTKGQPVIAPPAPPVTKPEEQDMVHDTDNEYNRLRDLTHRIRGRDLTREEYRKYLVGQTWLRCIELLSDNEESRQTQHAQEVGTTAVADDWHGQIIRLQSVQDEQQVKLSQLHTQVDKMKSIQAMDEIDDQLKAEALKVATAKVYTLTRQLEALNKQLSQPEPASSTAPVTAVQPADRPDSTIEPQTTTSWLARLLSAFVGDKA